jgi:uncharacterized membrane protein YdjX (TVP38/TMEM64 family)
VRDNVAVRSYARQILLFLCLVSAIVILRFSGLGEYLTLEALKEHRGALQQAVETHYVMSVLLFILVYISTCLAAPGALVLTLAGGLLFHTFPGSIYVVIGATSGAVLGFLLTRHVLGDRLQARYTVQLRQFNRELERNAPLYLLTVRLIPVLPFFLVNFLCGLTTLPLRTFTWTTAVGILPAALVYTFAGSQAGAISSLEDIFSPRLLLALFCISFLTLSPLLWKKAKEWKKAGGQNSTRRDQDA